MKQYIGGAIEIEEYKIQSKSRIKSGSEITLGVSYQEFQYSFYFEEGKEREYAFEIFRAEYLSDEGIRMGKRFTGVSTGIFAYAGEQELFVRADILE